MSHAVRHRRTDAAFRKGRREQTPESGEDEIRIVETFLRHAGALSAHRRRSYVMGASCLMMGGPAFWGLVWHEQYVIGAIGVLMAACSTLSDFVLVESPNFATRRLCFALDLLGIYLYAVTAVVVCLGSGLYAFTLITLAALIAGKFSVLEYGSWARSSAEWESRHSVWHVFITSLCVVVHGTIALAARGERPWSSLPPSSALGWAVLACAVEAALQLALTTALLPQGRSPLENGIGEATKAAPAAKAAAVKASPKPPAAAKADAKQPPTAEAGAKAAPAAKAAAKASPKPPAAAAAKAGAKQPRAAEAAGAKAASPAKVRKPSRPAKPNSKRGGNEEDAQAPAKRAKAAKC